MRLVHAVLLPGIVVFVSKATLLQALALRGDVTDDPPSGLHDTGVEVTADNESRGKRVLAEPTLVDLFRNHLREWIDMVNRIKNDPSDLHTAEGLEAIKNECFERYQVAYDIWHDHVSADGPFLESVAHKGPATYVAKINDLLDKDKHIVLPDMGAQH